MSAGESFHRKVGEYPIARPSEIEDKDGSTLHLAHLKFKLRCWRKFATTLVSLLSRRPIADSVMLESATESQIDAPSAGRLVIRIKLIPQEPLPLSLWQRLNKSALLVVGVAVLLLSWLLISTFRADPAPPAAESAVSTVVESPAPPATTTVPSSAEATPVEPKVPQQSEMPPSSIDEVLPDVPQSALDTIRGTVKVSVRVIVDQHGRVVRASAEDRGPSRYFERLSIAASKKWTFTPATSDEQRIMRVRFSFTRTGVTAEARPLP